MMSAKSFFVLGQYLLMSNSVDFSLDYFLIDFKKWVGEFCSLFMFIILNISIYIFIHNYCLMINNKINNEPFLHIVFTLLSILVFFSLLSLRSQT